MTADDAPQADFLAVEVITSNWRRMTMYSLTSKMTFCSVASIAFS
jgi:hypothetical protein